MRVDGQYSQEEITVMRYALDAACEALRFAFPGGVTDTVRRQLAFSVLTHFSEGKLCPKALSASALSELPPVAAAYAPLQRGDLLPQAPVGILSPKR
jgi:hypothetical protein